MPLRQAQQQANSQRGSVAQVHQQIQVLAAEQRSIDEQVRQQNQRRERLQADRNALAARGGAIGAHAGATGQAGSSEQLEILQARVNELQDHVPQLDEPAQPGAKALNDETHKQADLAARLDAQRPCGKKCEPMENWRPGCRKTRLCRTCRNCGRGWHVQQGWRMPWRQPARAHGRTGSRAARIGAMPLPAMRLRPN